jgi:hypothetical protein
LMARLEPGTPPQITPDQLTDLIASFEVANERTSTVRYVADYTFHFKPNAVRQLLQGAGTTYVEPAKPIVVLPVWHGGGQAVLWDDPNPWRDAWANHAPGQGAVPVIVPVGGLTDVSLIDAPKALSGDRAAIKALSARYQNDDVVVAIALPKDSPRRIDVAATRYSPAANPGAPQIVTLSTVAKSGESDADLLARAVADTIARLGQSWKAGNVLDTHLNGTLDVTVSASSLADWVAVRDRLRVLPAVRSLDLVSFNARQVRVTIHYVGSEDQLRAAFGTSGLELGGDDPNRTLTLRPGAPSAAPSPPTAPGSGSLPLAPPEGTLAPPAGGAGDLHSLRKANQQP